ncbi:MAG: hypothetical protein IT324_28625 [Anaerolineae bacterium]|nr:hypothetical protein [Anaerolineae bacterium]
MLGLILVLLSTCFSLPAAAAPTCHTELTPTADTPRAALIRRLCDLIGDKRLGLAVIPVDNPAAALEINGDDQIPAASSWKGAGAIYFFENTNPAIWSSVPIPYWYTQNILKVPVQYRAMWQKYHEILHDAYIMVVFSGNHEAGNILSYVYRNNGPYQADSNPILAFNDWSQQIVGVSAESGLYNWRYGGTTGEANLDRRYAERKLIDKGRALFYSNTFSARDLARFYLHLATVGKQHGYYKPAVQLLSIRNPIVSQIEAQVGSSISTATKDGYFRPDSPLSLGHDVNNDAGLLILPNGRVYAVAFMAFDAVVIEGAVIHTVIQALQANPPAL